jgi:hypothetical protein
MKRVIVAILAAAGLGGCVAVTPDGGYYPGYYGPTVGVGVGVYSAPGYYGGYRHRHRHHYYR